MSEKDAKIADALEYLSAFSTDKATWKFHKIKQEALIKAAYDKSKLKKPQFKQYLTYAKSIKGNARERIITEAKELLLKTEDLEKIRRKRAKKILKALL